VSVLEQTKSLIAEMQESEQQAQSTARADYLEILSRDADPRPGDAKRLKLILTVLGKSVDDLTADLQIVQQARRLETLSVVDPELAAEINAASQATVDYADATDAVMRGRREEQDKLDQHLAVLRGRNERARDAASKLTALKRTSWQLFGLPAPVQPAPRPAGMFYAKDQTTAAQPSPTGADRLPSVIPHVLPPSSGRLLPPADPGVVEAFKNRVGAD